LCKHHRGLASNPITLLCSAASRPVLNTPAGFCPTGGMVLLGLAHNGNTTRACGAAPWPSRAAPAAEARGAATRRARLARLHHARERGIGAEHQQQRQRAAQQRVRRQRGRRERPAALLRQQVVRHQQRGEQRRQQARLRGRARPGASGAGQARDRRVGHRRYGLCANAPAARAARPATPEAVHPTARAPA